MVASFGERSLTLTCEGERTRREVKGTMTQPPSAFPSAPLAALTSFERACVERMKEKERGKAELHYLKKNFKHMCT